jgi:hypothetical protein
MSTPGVAPAGTGVSILGIGLTQAGSGPAFTGAPTIALITISGILLGAGIVLVFASRKVAALPERRLGPVLVSPQTTLSGRRE